ncbi:MAG TPA: O-antigen ligase family protein [Bryobacteraceae bacterium]
MDRTVFTALLILGSIVLVNRWQIVIKTLQRSWPLAFFLLYCLVSIAWSDFPDIAFKRFIRELGNWVMILVLWTDPQPLAALTTLMARTSYLLIPLSVLFVKYYTIGRDYGFWVGETMYIGVTEDKNTLGMICVLFGVTSLWRLLNLVAKDGHNTHNRGRHLTVQCTILALVVFLLVKADSVTSISCAVLLTFVLVSLRCRMFARRRFLVHLLVLVIIAIPLLALFIAPSPDAFQAVGRTATLTDRTVIWAWVIKLVPNEWLGAGYSSFWLGERLNIMISNVTHTWVPNQAHNGYLEVFINLGWVGVGLLGLLILWGYFTIIAAWRQKRPASDLMLAYFLYGLISNISEASFFRNLVPAWLFFLIAITMPTVKRGQSYLPVIPCKPNRSAAAVFERTAFDTI